VYLGSTNEDNELQDYLYSWIMSNHVDDSDGESGFDGHLRCDNRRPNEVAMDSSAASNLGGPQISSSVNLTRKKLKYPKFTLKSARTTLSIASPAQLRSYEQAASNEHFSLPSAHKISLAAGSSALLNVPIASKPIRTPFRGYGHYTKLLGSRTVTDMEEGIDWNSEYSSQDNSVRTKSIGGYGKIGSLRHLARRSNGRGSKPSRLPRLFSEALDEYDGELRNETESSAIANEYRLFFLRSHCFIISIHKLILTHVIFQPWDAPSKPKDLPKSG
jgi:hypothetical protein